MVEEAKQRTEKRFFLSLFILVLILFAGLGIFNSTEQNRSEKVDSEVVEIPTPKSFSDIKNSSMDQLTVVSGIVYRHLVAYSLVCTEANMPLKNYPEYFSQKFKKLLKWMVKIE